MTSSSGADDSRRTFLRYAAGGVGASICGIGLSGLATRAPAQAGTGDLSAVELRDRLLQIRGVGGNVVLLDGPQGAALIDSGAPEHASALATFVEEQSGRANVDLLFNTHWHLSHTGGNERLAGAGAKVIAHENTRLWMTTEYYVDWEDHTYPPRPTAALPTDTFFSSDPQPLQIEFGDEWIEYGHLREAHTDGDIYVFLRERNVIAAGGVVAVGAYPVLDYATGGWIGGLMDATQKLLDLADRDTLIVPGSGPARTRDHLVAQYDMVSTVRGRVEEQMRKGRSAEEMIASGVTAEFDADWGANRERFISNVYDGLWWQGRLDGSL